MKRGLGLKKLAEKYNTQRLPGCMEELSKDVKTKENLINKGIVTHFSSIVTAS